MNTIRPANKFDIADLVRMLKNYRDAAPTEFLRSASDQTHIEALLSALIAGSGLVFVAVNGGITAGMLIAMRHTNVWNPTAYQMSELAYWVEPEFRGSTAGYRLLSEYMHKCDELVKSGGISTYTMSKMVTSPDLDYGRFGFMKLEETWVK